MRSRLRWACLCAVALIAGLDVSAAEKEYRVKGMVVSVNAPAKSFVVSHEKIAGLMDAMTMPFEVRQAADLREIVPGTVVEFTLVVGDSTSYATRITAVRYQTSLTFLQARIAGLRSAITGGR